MKHVNYRVFDESMTPDVFKTFIKKNATLHLDEPDVQELTLLDSFDGRLFKAGFIVTSTDNTLVVKKIESSEVVCRIETELPPPYSAQVFFNTGFYETASKVLDVRALLPHLTLKQAINGFNLRNKDQKIIARGCLQNGTLSREKDPVTKTLFFVNPLRGYKSEFEKALKELPEHKAVGSFETGLLKIFNTSITSYQKPRFKFDKEMQISEAFKSILSKSYAIMRQNETGVIDDIDIEFLHDYRVSGRRMRSALSLIKNVLTLDVSQALIQDLKWVGKTSGPLRDLDVYLLREQEYKRLIPNGETSKALRSIFTTLKNRRRRAQENMVTLLKSAEYQLVLQRWQSVFENFNTHVEFDRPVFGAASALIYKRVKRVLRDGAALNTQSPDELFHELRITCKKLRYLLEFFSSLYPAAEMTFTIKQLKKLQENLGDFNDLSVQIDTLSQFQANATRKNNTEYVQDISGLIAVLNFKKTQLRNEFYALFSEFSSAENRQLFKTLFKKQSSRPEPAA